VQKNEWVIVSGAAGAVGQAAIEIAHSKGAHVVALVKDRNERNSSMSGQVEALAQSDQNDLNNVVRAITDGRGANLALNGVGSSIFGNLLEALAIGGRQVVYSVAGGKEITLDLMALYKNQFTLLGLDTQKFNATDCAPILNELTPLFESGALKALPVSKRFALSDAPQAYSLVAAGRSGKVVLTMSS
jgi:NADPH2:quinone reductase